MEIYSERKEKIQDKQSSSLGQDGTWLKVIQRTSGDGFTHGPPRKESPLKVAKYTKGSWEDFIKHSDFLMEGKGIKIPPHAEDHFIVGMGTIAQIGEEHMFNLRGLKRINLVQKQSHVFDAQTKKFSTYTLPQQQQALWNARFKSDYTRYHSVNYRCPSASLSSQELAHTVYLSTIKNQQAGFIKEAGQSLKKQEQILVPVSSSARGKQSISEMKSDHVVGEQLPRSIRSLLVIPKEEKSYLSISKAKKENNQKLPSNRLQQQLLECQVTQEPCLDRQSRDNKRNNNHYGDRKQEQSQIQQESQSKNQNTIKLKTQDFVEKDIKSSSGEGAVKKAQLETQLPEYEQQPSNGFKTPLQRAYSVSGLRGSSWSDCGQQAYQGPRYLSSGEGRTKSFYQTICNQPNDMGDFDRHAKKRKGLPISDIQRQFREYQKSVDSIRFG